MPTAPTTNASTTAFADCKSTLHRGRAAPTLHPSSAATRVEPYACFLAIWFEGVRIACERRHSTRYVARGGKPNAVTRALASRLSRVVVVVVKRVVASAAAPADSTRLACAAAVSSSAYPTRRRRPSRASTNTSDASSSSGSCASPSHARAGGEGGGRSPGRARSPWRATAASRAAPHRARAADQRRFASAPHAPEVGCASVLNASTSSTAPVRGSGRTPTRTPRVSTQRRRRASEEEREPASAPTTPPARTRAAPPRETTSAIVTSSRPSVHVSTQSPADMAARDRPRATVWSRGADRSGGAKRTNVTSTGRTGDQLSRVQSGGVSRERWQMTARKLRRLTAK